jgi:hypothetical protein
MLKSIEKLVKKLIGIMLLLDINWHIIMIEVIQAEILRNKENSLPES